MTVDAARRPRRRSPGRSADSEPMPAPPTSIAIGEIGQTIFSCPSCSRPLALGAHRCPGCGLRLVRGVALGKASAFVVLGLAVGLLAGAGGGLAFGLTRAGPATAAVGAVPSAGPLTGSNGTGTATGTPKPSATTSAAPTATAPTDPGGIPPIARSALIQVVGTNARLTDAAAGLRAAVGARVIDSSAIAQILRSLSADSVFGQQLAVQVAAWPGTSALGGRLSTFYGKVHETAAAGLVASIQNRSAYRAAATSMLKLLDGLPTLDAAVRTAAGSAGVELPAASPSAP